MDVKVVDSPILLQSLDSKRVTYITRFPAVVSIVAARGLIIVVTRLERSDLTVTFRTPVKRLKNRKLNYFTKHLNIQFYSLAYFIYIYKFVGHVGTR